MRTDIPITPVTKKETPLRSTCDQPLPFTEEEVRLLIKND